MPTPIAHSIVSYLFQEYKPHLFFKSYFKNFIFLIVLSNLPDIDFLPGFLIGEPNRFHHYYSHTLGCAIFLGLILGFIFFKKNKGNFLLYFFTVTTLYYSHIILDFFTQDNTPPFGVMLFWPINNFFYISPFSLFKSVQRSGVSSDFFISLFNSHNFEGAIREIFVMLLIALSLKVYKKL